MKKIVELYLYAHHWKAQVFKDKHTNLFRELKKEIRSICKYHHLHTLISIFEATEPLFNVLFKQL